VSRRPAASDCDAVPDAEAGYVAVLVAISLPLFIVLAGLAVDVANWYAQGQRVQQAADAAALAGSVYLPLDPVAATNSALDYARRNGYAATAGTTGSGSGTGSVTVTPVQLADQPSRMQVTISATVKNVFGAMFGRPTTVITRTAVADYAGPIPLGSPCNVFGVEPVGAGDSSESSQACAGAGDFWLNVAGPATVKQDGDAYQATQCRPGNDGCLDGQNIDYVNGGYEYVVQSAVSQPLAISVFDPAFVPVGDHCTDPDLVGAAALTDAVVPDPAVRYATGPRGGGQSDFCTGDTLYAPGAAGWPATGDGDGKPVTTSFDVRGPFDGTDVAAAPVVPGCTRQFAGYGGAGVTLNLAAMLSQSSPAYDPALAAEFRRWVTLCTVQASAGERYVVQIRTNVALGENPATAPGDPNLPGGGQNRMALRASGGSQTTVSAFQRMSIFANSHHADTSFYLARIGSGAAGHLLKLSFFDIGDANGGVSGTLTVQAPPDAVDTATGQPLSFDSTDAQGRALCQGSGVVTGDLPTCGVTSTSTGGASQFDGRTEVISVNLPSTYRCNDADPLGCWVKVEYAFNGPVDDTTSWSAALEGDPVRLVP
jgi:Flp pilus assembly protein TadG